MVLGADLNSKVRPSYSISYSFSEANGLKNEISASLSFIETFDAYE
jgi:hypothetical protein